MTAAWLVPLLHDWGLVLVFAGVLLEHAGLPLPGETCVLAGGYLAQRGLLPLPLVIAVAIAAAVLGDNLGYAIGRRWGGGLERLGRWVGLRPGGLARLKASFAEHGARAVFAARFVTGLRTFAALVAGAVGVPWLGFFWRQAAGAVLWAGLMGGVGYGFAAMWQDLGGALSLVGLFALGLAVAITAIVLLARHGRRFLPAAGWHPAPRELLLSLANLAAIAVFVTIAERVLDQRTMDFDRSFELQVHALASPALTFLMRRLSDIGAVYFVVPVLLVLTMLAWARGDRRAALVVVGMTIASEALNYWLKIGFTRARPTLWVGALHPRDYSFPSGHSMGAVANWGIIAVVSMRLWPRSTWALRIATPLLIIGIGLSRIYLGAHWPTDVLAGFTAGAFMLAAAMYALGRPLPHGDGTSREPAPPSGGQAAVIP